MLTVTLICTGRLREPHYIAAFSEYAKRLGAFCRFETIELAEAKTPQSPSEALIAAALKKEAAEVERHIPAGAMTVAMCVEGRELSSGELAELFASAAISGRSRICFIIGSSFGIDEDLKKKADLRLSMSKMTFPHHLVRVMLAEQVYRAMSINEGGKYHK